MKDQKKRLSHLPDVTLILTGYNEGSILKNNLETIKRILDRMKYSWEIILIDDKSSDNTPEIFVSFAKKYKNISVYQHSENIGRGGSISEGIRRAKGDIVGYLDTDLELSPIHIPEFVEAIQSGNDGAFGMRSYSFPQDTIFRVLLSIGYKKIVQYFLSIQVEDSATGFKFFKRKSILPILEMVKDSRWFFDTEIVARCILANHSIIHIPVTYKKNPLKKSSVHFIKDTIDYLILLWNFRRQLIHEGKITSSFLF